MQDEVRDKSVAFVISVGKTGGRLTADLLKAAMRRYLEHSRHPQTHHGKQTVKQLVEQGAGIRNIEITDKNIKSFERVARKYGVDFALKKDPAEGKYLVFFKSRDADALNAVPLRSPPCWPASATSKKWQSRWPRIGRRTGRRGRWSGEAGCEEVPASKLPLCVPVLVL